MTEFTDLGLAEPILRAIKAEGYANPTPIQAQVVPAMLAGRDVLGIAQTGTGKTAAFVLPILHRLENRDGRPPRKGCEALILAPTRELAAQIADNIRTYARYMRVSVVVVVGGVKPGPQIRALASGAHIVVATPGRLLDHMNAGVFHPDHTSQVVLDEADQMLDLGFVPAIRKIMARLPDERQTMLLSATMPKPIRALAREFQTDPQEIAVAAVSRPVERIEQSVRHVPAAGKRAALAELLADPGITRAIVFTRTKHGADKVTRHLTDEGLGAVAIHGNKSQNQRQAALGRFRSGKTPILVATDIAARGIDVDDVSHVINFELPNVPEAYVHRIGRTARAGRTGVAISLCDPTERGYLRDIERLTGIRIGIDGAEPEYDPSEAGRSGDGGRMRKPRRKKTPHRGQPGYGQGRSASGENRQARDGGERKQGGGNGFDRAASDRNGSDRNGAARKHADRHHGDRNFGDRTTADRNSGDRNSGDRHFGERSTGDHKSSDRKGGPRKNAGQKRFGVNGSGPKQRSGKPGGKPAGKRPRKQGPSRRPDNQKAA